MHHIDSKKTPQLKIGEEVWESNMWNYIHGITLKVKL